ncbi:DUF4158 domain-containing protein [Nonomuraea deserti]|uniref:DUF4158 domain-containing protein n=1 Tax=Nonomuraea deserti TaxID=1848322 RepID=A0A4R4VKV9_9ACTN|nr:DUF4158 domain-containing protein [Nonomuraea deserti]TDD02954.1 DUF4158 domain-containing protein [Nonomuraea deserti]
MTPAALRLYGKRDQTRSDHLGLIAKYLEWQTAPAGSQAMKELEQFLLDRAMEHDSPTLLFNLAREYLMAAKVIRPGVLILAKMVGTARKAASDLTSQLVGHLLTAEVRADLERMLVVDAGLGMTRLEWLVSPARDASSTSVKTAIDKLTWLRAIDAHQMDVSVLPNERRRFLAQVARRSTNQGLERRKERKFPILLAFVAQAAVDQLDEVVALLDQAVSARESRAKSKTDEALVERAKKGEARQLVMDVILPVLADPSIPDDEVGGMLRERIGMQRLREITSDAWTPLPRDHGRLSELESSYTYLRQFTPNVLAAIDFQPHLEQQTEQAWCLTLLTNSVVAWTTEYYSRAVLELRSQGREVSDEILSHTSPGHSDNINFFGVINVDVEAELAKLDTSGWRPLRPAQLRELGLTP